MGAPPGTSLDDPVTEEQVPDLRSGLHEIKEYFQKQGAYDLFDFLLKELLTQQPADPLEHMLGCLKSEIPTGPLKVIVASPPGMGRAIYARRLARHFGLEHISAGDLLKSTGADTRNVGFHSYNDEEKAAKLVCERVQQCSEQMRGWVLDGFPRTRFQASFLKEYSVVPTHVLCLQATEDVIRERQRRILDGEIEDAEYTAPEVLEKKLRLHSCHSSPALETYAHLIHVIDTSPGEDYIWSEMDRTVRMLPRSKGPQPPPRVVVMGPRGVGVMEHASRLAAKLGAVFVDGAAPLHKDKRESSARQALQRSRTSMDVPNVKPLVDGDRLGAVGVRLRQPDCVKQGFVLCNFPTNVGMAKILAEDLRLQPTRVVALAASAETCIARLRHILTDPVTSKIWISVPRNPELRRRLKRNPEDQPTAVQASHDEYTRTFPGIMQVLGCDGRGTQIPADDGPQAVFTKIAEFVERPLPLGLQDEY